MNWALNKGKFINGLYKYRTRVRINTIRCEESSADPEQQRRQSSNRKTNRPDDQFLAEESSRLQKHCCDWSYFNSFWCHFKIILLKVCKVIYNYFSNVDIKCFFNYELLNILVKKPLLRTKCMNNTRNRRLHEGYC